MHELTTGAVMGWPPLAGGSTNAGHLARARQGRCNRRVPHRAAATPQHGEVSDAALALSIREPARGERALTPSGSYADYRLVSRSLQEMRLQASVTQMVSEQGQARSRRTRMKGSSSAACAHDRHVYLHSACVLLVRVKLILSTSQIAAARYASHLSGCMGLGGSRRSGGRGSTAMTAKPNGFPRRDSVSDQPLIIRLCADVSEPLRRPNSVASSHGSDTDTAGSLFIP